MHFSDLHIFESTMPLIIKFFIKIKKPIWKILRTDKNNNFKFIIKFLMTLDRSYIGYLGFLGIDLFKSVLMYSNGAICLIKLLFDLGLFTVYNLEDVSLNTLRGHEPSALITKKAYEVKSSIGLRVSPSPRNQRGGAFSPAGEGLGRSQFRR